MGLALLNVEVESDINAMISEDMPSRQAILSIEDMFGGNDYIFVVLETEDILRESTLLRLWNLTAAFESSPEFSKVTSLFTMKQINGEFGMMTVDPAIPFIPEDQHEKDLLRQKLKKNTLISGITVSKDFTRTAILLTASKNTDPNLIPGKIQTILNSCPGNEKTYIGGLPIIKATIVNDIFHDLKLLLPIGFFLMICMLYVSFRQLRGVILPFSVVFLSILLAFGLMGVLSWKIAIVSILMPVMLIAVANDYGIHMISRYQELLREDPTIPRFTLCNATLQSMKKPIIITGATTVVGILGLLFHVIVHARQVGVLAAAGILWAVVLSLLFIPAVLSFLPRKVPVNKRKPHKRFLLDRQLASLAGFITRRPKLVVIVSVLLVAILSLGIFNLKIDGNLVNFFKKNHPVKISNQIINDHFGGAQAVSVIFSGDMTDPDILARMVDYETQLMKDPNVGDVSCEVDVLKEISKGLFDPDEKGYNALPETSRAIAQYLELYFMSGEPDDFEQLLDLNYTHSQMLVRINNSDSYIINDVIKKIRLLTEDDPAVSMIGGHAMVTHDITTAIVSGQTRSLLIAILGVAFMMMIFFRSLKGGLFSLIPLLAAEAILFGLMGYSGIKLDVATALLSSIMIGVGIDYTIHFLWRFREELHAGNSYETAVSKTLQGAGRGIFFNALSVIVGFAALFFSAFRPIQYFGFLVVISIISCLAGALILMPALCILLKPKFLNPNFKRKLS